MEIFYKSSEFIAIRRMAQYTITSLVADCGGVLGLFMGCSLISLAEIIYYCTIRPIILCHHRRRRRSQHNQYLNTKTLDKNNQTRVLQVKEMNKIHTVGNVTKTMNEINSLPIECQYYYN